MLVVITRAEAVSPARNVSAERLTDKIRTGSVSDAYATPGGNPGCASSEEAVGTAAVSCCGVGEGEDCGDIFRCSGSLGCRTDACASGRCGTNRPGNAGGALGRCVGLFVAALCPGLGGGLFARSPGLYALPCGLGDRLTLASRTSERQDALCAITVSSTPNARRKRNARSGLYFGTRDPGVLASCE